MIDIAAITSGKQLPSTQYRIRQYMPLLLNAGIHVREYCPAVDKWAPVPGKPGRVTNRQILPFYVLWQGLKLATRVPGIIGSYRHDISWLNKELLPGYSTLEGLLGSPLVSDIDDAIWLTPPFGERVARRIGQRSDVLVVGNDYLANWFGNCTSQVHILPTAVDASLFCPGAQKETDDVFVVGWIGSQGNLPYLSDIEPALKAFLSSRKDARLLVVSDAKPEFRELPPNQVVYLPWTRETEVASIQEMDVGLMPLADSDWAHGKCAFKMLQYMAVGLPVVVSPVGMNAQLLEMGELGYGAANPDDWIDALEYLYANREHGRCMGALGRQVVKTHFDLPVIGGKLAAIFKSL
ncbi:glycosyltransferase family 4 protein [Thiolapillus sp.]